MSSLVPLLNKQQIMSNVGADLRQQRSGIRMDKSNESADEGAATS